MTVSLELPKTAAMEDGETPIAYRVVASPLPYASIKALNARAKCLCVKNVFMYIATNNCV